MPVSNQEEQKIQISYEDCSQLYEESEGEMDHKISSLYEVDSSGCLKFSIFDADTNIKFAACMKKLFEKFKNNPNLSEKNPSTFVNSLYNHFNQHVSKYFKKHEKLNQDCLDCAFRQIVAFMIDKKCMGGQILKILVKENMLRKQELDDFLTATRDEHALKQLLATYGQENDQDASDNEESTKNSLDEYIKDIKIKTAKIVLDDILSKKMDHAKWKKSISKKINKIIKDLDSELKIHNINEVKQGVLSLLEDKQIITYAHNKKKQFNFDKIVEVKKSLDKDDLELILELNY